MPDAWRLFIAIELPVSIIDFLGKTLETVKKHTPHRTVRWVKPESTHLTLKFLGDVPVTQRDTLQQALERAASDHTAFDLATGQLGCFPHSRQPRVVWVGLERDLAALQALRDSAEALISPLGYPTEKRAYHPHLTLGRVQRDANRDHVQQLGKLVDTTKLPDSVRWHVNQVTLFRSELSPQGAQYTPLFHAPLKQHEQA